MIGNTEQAVADSAGNVSIAPELLVRLIDRGLAALPGIVRPGTIPPQRANAATAVAPGIALAIAGNGVSVDCYLVARAGVSLIEVGCAAQLVVAEIIAAHAGLRTAAVNIRFEDVDDPARSGGGEAHG
jgi:uncharacterized alkaline shock family protein YloU